LPDMISLKARFDFRPDYEHPRHCTDHQQSCSDCHGGHKTAAG
jgi:hypothetical protein